MILITGASGNAGAEVLRQTLKTGAKLRAAFQSPDKASAAPSGVEVAIMDYKKPETSRPALAGIERLFLVAPVVPNIPDLENNVVTEARKAGVRHIVKFSAMGGRDAIFPRLHTDASEGTPSEHRHAVVFAHRYERVRRCGSYHVRQAPVRTHDRSAKPQCDRHSQWRSQCANSGYGCSRRCRRQLRC